MRDIILIIAPAIDVCAAVGYVMQAVRIIKRRSSKDLSIPSWVIKVISCYLWILYGYCLGRDGLTFMIDNIIYSAVCSINLFLIIYYRVQRRR